jgi:hypothetical protein
MRSVSVMVAAWILANVAAPAAEPTAWMPRVEDYTHMGWAEKFPSHDSSAPWRRWIETGYYALALDTDTLAIPHLGPVPPGADYGACARADRGRFASLPPADLVLEITADGRRYRATSGGTWDDFRGPRLVESGRFFQRADVTDLAFTAEDGSRLNVEARLETAAWPDRLGLILAARPGLKPIPAGEACFGRLGGGFGLDGANHLEIAHRPEIDPERFTLEFWAFMPADFRASNRTYPWLACKNRNEHADGNFGIMVVGETLRATMNIGGGRDGTFVVDAPRRPALRAEAWNHLAMSYDGDALRLYVDGEPAGEKQIGLRRTPGRDGLAFGRRQDGFADGYHFRGAVDEIQIYDRALTAAEIRRRAAAPDAEPPSPPVGQWSFRADGEPSPAKPSERWRDAAMEIRLTAAGRELHQHWDLPKDQVWTHPDWREVFLSIDPVSGNSSAETGDGVTVEAMELPTGSARPVDYDRARGWHRVSLDGVVPIVPAGGPERQNDAMERVRLVLANPTESEQVARLLFEKAAGGFRQSFGSAVTGMSAVLRDAAGRPTGIPVQLSKNWHGRPEGGVYSGLWFHGLSQVRLPPQAKVELELAIAYGHWGGVAAASHAQLCLIGWGSNQLWNQSALGSWGESICYEPDQVQAEAAVLDVRPLMVRSMDGDRPWSWTHNVGGGDFFRLFDAAGQRVFPGGMRTAYRRYGPCLTEVTFAGHTGPAIKQSATVSLCRSDDIVRGVYRLRMDVTEPLEFSRLVLFQIGADSYGYTGERKMAWGNETGLVHEWNTQWGGDTYRTEPVECAGKVPWISLHEAVSRAEPGQGGAWANRGVVIRQWNARLGGRPAAPWLAERGVNARGVDTSTADIVPPPGVRKLEPGDFVEAVIEHVIMPQFARDYYGPNAALRAALEKWENTWRMIHREAVENDRQTTASVGTVEGRWPALTVRAVGDRAECTLVGGMGYVPLTFTGLSAPSRHLLYVDDRPLDQSTHGNDFWQTDYDPASHTWELTFNIPVDDPRPRKIRLAKEP